MEKRIKDLSDGLAWVGWSRFPAFKTPQLLGRLVGW